MTRRRRAPAGRTRRADAPAPRLRLRAARLHSRSVVSRWSWQELLSAARDGNESALQELLLVIRQPCQQAAFGVLRDRQLSEDVAQEVAIALITNPPRIESDLYAYVRQCARNRALRSAEGRRREVSLDDARLESERDRTSVPTDPLAWQAVADAMLELKREYSEAVQLAAQGFSAKEIAASQRCSVHAVQNQILRGRQRAWKLLPAGVRKRYPMFGAGFTPRSVVRARNSRRRKSEEEE